MNTFKVEVGVATPLYADRRSAGAWFALLGTNGSSRDRKFALRCSSSLSCYSSPRGSFAVFSA
jgi:hypothetical protein